MKKQKLTLILLSLCLACTFIANGITLVNKNPVVNASSVVTVDLTKPYQTMDGWGTSLSWWGNAVGGWDMIGASGLEKREEISNLIFSPEGLNINIVRYNLGGGDDPTHTHMKDMRGMPGIKPEADSDYDLANDARQLWILQKANEIRTDENGNSDIINEIFSNSVPYWLSQSGCASGNTSKSWDNLIEGKENEYATWFVDCMQLIIESGINFDYVETMNEPGSDYWGAFGSQEGNKVSSGTNQSAMIMAVYNEIEKRGLFEKYGMQMTGCDETNPSLAYSNFLKLSQEAQNVIEKVNYHTYSKSVSGNKSLSSLAYNNNYNDPAYKLWMSEICYGSGEPSDLDSMMQPMLMAKDIKSDLYDAHVSGWVIWQAVETYLGNRMSGCNYGLIQGVYQDPGNTEYGFNMEAEAMYRGDYFISKQYYALGQYSKYIKQGYTIIDIGDDNSVAAISPDRKELVIVTSNSTTDCVQNTYFTKSFIANKAKRIITTSQKNWEESEIAVNGSYITDEIEGESIVTYVLTGEVNENINNASPIVFNGLTIKNSTLYADYVLPQDTSATLYYGKNPIQIPFSSTSGMFSLPLDRNSKSVSVTVPPALKACNAVIVCEVNGVKQYSAVISFNQSDTLNGEFEYFTSAGKTNKTSLDGTPVSFGNNNGISDQPFGTDIFTGKKWGYTTANTEEYNSNDVFENARYSNTLELEYKYQVDSGKEYNLCIGFKDPWGVSGRATDIYVNGTLKQSVADVTELTVVNISGVTGKTEGGVSYITITLKATTSNKPIVNFIAIQNNEQDAVALCAGEIVSSILEPDKSLEDVLLKEVELTTTKGTKKSSDITLVDVEYVETSSGAMLQINYKENQSGIICTQYVVIPNEKGGIYYYIDLGQLDPVAGALTAYNNIALIHSATLLNKDCMDKYASDENDWGRLGDPSIWSDYYQTDSDISSSCAEVKTSTYVGNTKRKTIEIRMPGLKAGNYIVEVGVNMHGWGSARRAVTFLMGDTQIGYKADYGDLNVWEFEYTKTNDDTVVFKAYTEGSNPDNVLLGYVIVRENVALNEENVKTPVITTSLSQDTTEIRVKELTEGSVLYLINEKNKVLASTNIGANEAQNGYVFQNLNLTESESVGIVVTKNGKIVKTSKINLSILQNTTPRLEWSANADTIELTVMSEAGISTIEYRHEDDSTWTNIKRERYFRATKNGNYHVKMVLMNNEVIEKVIAVTHVDSCEINILTDLNAWQKQSVSYEAMLSCETGVKTLTLSNGSDSIDVTEFYKDGIFKYTFTQNGEYTLTCESIQGNNFNFNVLINRIDGEIPKLSFETSSVGGVFQINLTKNETLSSSRVFVESEGKKVELYQDYYKMYKSGSYLFTIVNEAGSESKYVINFGASLTANENLTLTKTNQTVSVVSKKNGASKMQVYSADASSVITNGSIDVSKAGVYSVVVSYDDGSFDVVNFVVKASEIADKTQADKKGCIDAIQISAIVFALLACGIVLVLVKKAKGGRKNEK